MSRVLGHSKLTVLENAVPNFLLTRKMVCFAKWKTVKRGIKDRSTQAFLIDGGRDTDFPALFDAKERVARSRKGRLCFNLGKSCANWFFFAKRDSICKTMVAMAFGSLGRYAASSKTCC